MRETWKFEIKSNLYRKCVTLQKRGAKFAVGFSDDSRRGKNCRFVRRDKKKKNLTLKLTLPTLGLASDGRTSLGYVRFSTG